MFNRLRDWLVRRKRAKLFRQCDDGPLKQYYASPLPSLNTKISDVEFLVVDLEMTGLKPKEDDILSIGTTLIKTKTIDHSASRHQLIFHPNADLTRSAPIHRIFNQELMQGIDLKESFDLLLSQIKGRVMVFHHAALDTGFLSSACNKFYGTNLFAPTVDTMQLEQQRLRQQGRELHKLGLADTRQRYGLPNYSAHNAAIDALATAELLLAQLSYIDPNNDQTLGALL